MYQIRNKGPNGATETKLFTEGKPLYGPNVSVSTFHFAKLQPHLTFKRHQSKYETVQYIKASITICRVQDVNVNRCGNGVRGGTGVVAAVTFVRVLEVQGARPTVVQHVDAGVVVDHVRLVEPEDERGLLGRLPQEALHGQQRTGPDVDVGCPWDFCGGLWNRVVLSLY